LKPFTRKHFRVWAMQLTLDTGDPWILDGWELDFADDLFRGVKECWLVVPEGNGKTTFVAGLALYYLEHTPMAEIPIAAAAIIQANTLFNQAQGLVISSPHMYALAPDRLAQATGKAKMYMPRFECQRGLKRIRHHTGGYIEIRSSDENTSDGVIPGGIAVCEELHRHKTMELYKIWKGKLKKRNAQMVVISTAGEPGSQFEKTRSSFRTVGEVTRRGCRTRALNGKLSVIHDWAVPEKGDVLDLKLVARANPSKRITVETLAMERESPSWEINHWRRFTCNLPTRSHGAAITEQEWLAAEDQGAEIPVGESIVAGLDLGWKYDTTAIVPLWWRDSEYRLLGESRVLVPPRDGHSLHPDLIKSALIELNERNPIHTLVMDVSNGHDIANWVDDELPCTTVDRGQSNSFACADYEAFMEALRNGWLRHVGDPDLTQHALNAITRVATYGDLRFSRPADGQSSARLQEVRVIDALVAAAMAHSVAAEALNRSGIQVAFA